MFYIKRTKRILKMFILVSLNVVKRQIIQIKLLMNEKINISAEKWAPTKHQRWQTSICTHLGKIFIKRFPQHPAENHSLRHCQFPLSFWHAIFFKRTYTCLTDSLLSDIFSAKHITTFFNLSFSLSNLMLRVWSIFVIFSSRLSFDQQKEVDSLGSKNF